MTADSPAPRPASGSSVAPPTPSAAADVPPPAEPPAGTESPEDGARTPAQYTEPPGSHRRPSDGAALDVGG